MEGKRKISVINLILIILLVLCATMCGLILLLSNSKISVTMAEKSASEIKNNYTTIEETSTNTWDISANEDASVIATLSGDGTLTISGTGDMKCWNYDDRTDWHGMKEQVKNVIIKKGVTNIGNYAFYECKSLTNIEISKGVTSIGSCSFSYCRSLTSMEIPEGVTGIGYRTFFFCRSLASIGIPSSVTSIETDAFSDCTSLTEIEIPESVTSIGKNAFSRCQVTKFIDINNDIELPNILKRVQDENDILYSSEGFEFTNCTLDGTTLKVEEGYTYIKIKVLSGKLMNLTYLISQSEWDVSANEDDSVIATLSEEGILTISGTGAMKNWGSYSADWYEVRTQIKMVAINGGITSIGKYAFHGCENLTEIKISESVMCIEDGAFFDCDNLMSIEIPNIVESIGNNAFKSCDKLKQFEVSDENTTYCDVEGVLYTKDERKIIKYPEGKKETAYNIPSSVTIIGSSAFCDCTSLEKIKIPSSVVWIANSAFIGCTGLKSIEVPSSVGTIEIQAFYFCENLSTIIIPNSVASIGSKVFDGCDKLTIICKSGTKAETYAINNSINYTIDDVGPKVEITENGKTSAVKKEAVTVTVTDEGAGVDEENLKYLWSTKSENVTKDQITNTFENGQTLEIKDVTGTYYLWIYAIDKLGNETIERSNGFKIDNIAPTATVNYSTTEPTNQNVTVTIKVNEEIGIKGATGWKLSSNAQELTKEYTENTVKEENIIIIDTAGNETTVNIKITNIDKTNPELKVETEIKENEVRVQVEATDEGSGINEDSYKYYIKKENGTYGNAVKSGATHAFTDLEYEIKYIIKVEVSDNVGNTVNSEVEVTIQKEYKITSTTLVIDEENLIIKEIQPNTIVEEIKRNLQSNCSYEVQDKNGNTVSSESNIGTGYQIKLENNKTYTIIVTGDTNGDGQADIKDILAINKHRLNKANLTGEYLLGSDVNGDGKADIRDILQINKFRLGKIREL